LLWTLLKNVLTGLGTHCSPQDFATHAKLVEHGSYASFCWYWVVVGLSLLRFTFSNCSQKVDQILDRLNTHAFWNSASRQKISKINIFVRNDLHHPGPPFCNDLTSYGRLLFGESYAFLL